jgi:hypothetical protein
VGTETWDDPLKCAKFIERFTSHTLDDAECFNLRDYTRNDLEGMIQLLHGYYTHFMLESPAHVRKDMECRAVDVLTSMSLVSSMQIDEKGEIILNDELWEIAKNSPHLLRFLACTNTK